jgi:hypothetical protein
MLRYTIKYIKYLCLLPLFLLVMGGTVGIQLYLHQCCQQHCGNRTTLQYNLNKCPHHKDNPNSHNNSNNHDNHSHPDASPASSASTLPLGLNEECCSNQPLTLTLNTYESPQHSNTLPSISTCSAFLIQCPLLHNPQRICLATPTHIPLPAYDRNMPLRI